VKRNSSTRIADKRELLGRLHGAEEINATPYYAWSVSMQTRVAVYKALCACDPDSAFNDWRNLSYATEAGIVFG
jgi:hypothetical protein